MLWAAIPRPSADSTLSQLCAGVLGRLHDNLTGHIAYAEPSDLAAIFRAQRDYARDTHQIQVVAVAEKRLPAVVVGHDLPYTLETTELITQIAYFSFVHTLCTVRQLRASTSPTPTGFHYVPMHWTHALPGALLC